MLLYAIIVISVSASSFIAGWRLRDAQLAAAREAGVCRCGPEDVCKTCAIIEPGKLTQADAYIEDEAREGGPQATLTVGTAEWLEARDRRKAE